MEKQESIRAASRGHSVGWTGVAGAEEVLDLVMIMVKSGRSKMALKENGCYGLLIL